MNKAKLLKEILENEALAVEVDVKFVSLWSSRDEQTDDLIERAKDVKGDLVEELESRVREVIEDLLLELE